MACKQWKERLVTLLYDELDADERRELEQHLIGCAGCRTDLDELASVRTLLAEARVEAPRVSPRVLVLAPKTLHGLPDSRCASRWPLHHQRRLEWIPHL